MIRIGKMNGEQRPKYVLLETTGLPMAPKSAPKIDPKASRPGKQKRAYRVHENPPDGIGEGPEMDLKVAKQRSQNKKVIGKHIILQTYGWKNQKIIAR